MRMYTLLDEYRLLGCMYVCMYTIKFEFCSTSDESLNRKKSLLKLFFFGERRSFHFFLTNYSSTINKSLIMNIEIINKKSLIKGVLLN